MATSTARDNKAHGRLQRSAGYASLCVALLLIATKIWAWQLTGSVSILSSLVDSFLDLIASTITVVAIYYSLRPADSEHRFGHGKSEGLAALAQAFIITGSAVYVFKEAVERLLDPQPVTNPETGIGVMLVSIAVTLALVTYQRYVVRITNSVAIAADSVHYRADLLLNLSVLVTVAVSSWTNQPLLDALVGIAIAAYIVWSVYGIATKALDVLLDRELPADDRERIRDIAISHPEVHGFHDLRTRYGGNTYFIQFHLELQPTTTLVESHKIMDQVEDNIRAQYPRCEIIVHTDPLGFEESRDAFD
jgi:ferrous-iron efflux pump FieF